MSKEPVQEGGAMARESQDGLLVYLGISAAVHSHRGACPSAEESGQIETLDATGNSS